MAVIGTGGAVNKSSSSSSKSKKSVGASGTVSTEDLTKYSNDYKAEIDKRSAVDPNDPSLRTLTKLRNQKMADIAGGYIAADGTPAWLNLQTDMANAVGSGSVGGGLSNMDYYDRMLEEQTKSIQQRTQSAIDANNAYIPKVNQQSDKALQDAYVLREQARVRAPEALAALGLHGGASETHLMGINTNYENTRNQTEQARRQALDNIYQNEQQIRATGDATLADASANYYNQSVAAQRAAQAQLQQQANWEAEFGLKQQDYENRLAQQAWDNWYNEQLLGLKQTSANKSTGGSSGGGGSGGGGGTTDKNISGNYNVVLNNVKRALGGSNAGSQAAFDAVVNYIQNSLRQGMITEYEAQQMINQLGLS